MVILVFCLMRMTSQLSKRSVSMTIPFEKNIFADNGGRTQKWHGLKDKRGKIFLVTYLSVVPHRTKRSIDSLYIDPACIQRPEDCEIHAVIEVSSVIDEEEQDATEIVRSTTCSSGTVNPTKFHNSNNCS